MTIHPQTDRSTQRSRRYSIHDDEPGPEWYDGTVAILSAVGAASRTPSRFHGGFRAGPASAALRARVAAVRSRGCVRIRVRRWRSSVRGRLEYGAWRATVVVESLEGADNVAAVALDVERIDDHGRAEFEILDGVRWR